MSAVAFTLLSDGSSERALLPLLRALLEDQLPGIALEDQWADLRRLPNPPKSLSDRISTAIELYPCAILFVHRDAEGQGWQQRRSEIEQAVKAATSNGVDLPTVVCTIPVRMLEAWLLVDEPAIRRAAGNPNGQEPLEIPKLDHLESIPDPKSLLFDALRTASGLSGVRRKRFPVHARVHRIADFVTDLTRLRQLDSFKRTEEQLRELTGSWRVR